MDRQSPETMMGKLMAACSPIRLKKTSKPKLRNWQQSPNSNIAPSGLQPKIHSGLQRTNSDRQHSTPTRPESISSSRSLQRAHSEKITRRNSYSPKTQSLINQARSSSPVPCSPMLRPAGAPDIGKIPALTGDGSLRESQISSSPPMLFVFVSGQRVFIVYAHSFRRTNSNT